MYTCLQVAPSGRAIAASTLHNPPSARTHPASLSGNHPDASPVPVSATASAAPAATATATEAATLAGAGGGDGADAGGSASAVASGARAVGGSSPRSIPSTARGGAQRSLCDKRCSAERLWIAVMLGGPLVTGKRCWGPWQTLEMLSGPCHYCLQALCLPSNHTPGASHQLRCHVCRPGRRGAVLVVIVHGLPGGHARPRRHPPRIAHRADVASSSHRPAAARGARRPAQLGQHAQHRVRDAGARFRGERALCRLHSRESRAALAAHRTVCERR